MKTTKPPLLRALLVAAVAIGLTSCAAQPVNKVSSDRFIEGLTYTPPAEPRKVPTPAPLPARAEPSTEERIDVHVSNVGAQAFFLGLVDGTPHNLVVHPDVSGSISLSLKQVTVSQVLRTVRETYGFDFRRTAAGYLILPATLQNRVFEIDYLNLIRAGTSRTRVSSGQISQVGRSNGSNNSAFSNNGNNDNNSNQSGDQTTGSRIETTTSADFWSEMERTLQAIVGAEQGRQVVVNAHAGVVFIRAMPEELRSVNDYLRQIHEASHRQVVLEAKIVEVTLSHGAQAGINWSAVGITDDGYTIGGAQRSGGTRITDDLPLGGDVIDIAPGNPVTSFPSETVGGAFVAALDIGEFSAFIELLSTQGETRVLSSPRVATLNNQKAVIKAGSDEFFVTDISSNTVTGTAATTSRDVTLTPFFSGIALDVTPHISASVEVILHIHPTVSEVTDQTKELTVSGERDELPLAFSQIREADSVVKAQSGQIIAIGGLMRDSSQQVDFATPGFSDIPGLGRLFKSQRTVKTKTELVILLRPLVIGAGDEWDDLVNPSLERIKEMLPEVAESAPASGGAN